MSEPIEARKKIEALEQLLGVDLPRDRPVVVEIRDQRELDLDQVVGGLILQSCAKGSHIKTVVIE